MKTLFLFFTTFLPLQGQFITPSWQGSTNSEFAAWDNFTEPSVAANSPDVSSDAPSNDAEIICTTNNAFLTSSGNLYSFLSPLSLQLNDAAPFPIANIFLQVTVFGVEIDLSSVRLIPPDATSIEDIVFPAQSFLVSQENLTGESGGPGSGLGTTYAFQWDLSSAPISGTYSILFGSSESSMSLDKVALHTSDTFFVVPEPTIQLPAPTIQYTQGNILLTWAVEAGEELELQKSGTPAIPESWQAVGTPPTQTESHFQINLPAAETPTFFRLKRQDTAQ